MQPVPLLSQQPLVERLYQACGGHYAPQTRRKYKISGPQWAAAYQGQAIFHAPTRQPITFEHVIEQFGKIGIPFWATHDSDVIPTEYMGREAQWEIVERINTCLQNNGVACSMTTTETFHHPVFATGPGSEVPQILDYTAFRLKNNVRIAHSLGASHLVYWPGTLGYMVQGAVDEMAMLQRFAAGLNAACDEDIITAQSLGRQTMKHCLEAKPFEPAAQILLPSSDAMLAFIASGLLKHPHMVGLNPEYLHELMWGGAARAVLARALLAGKLFHFDINDGYPLKHDIDLPMGCVNPLDWLNVLILLRSQGFDGPFNLDFKPPRTVSNHAVFTFSFPSVVDRFITLWEMAGEALADPIISEAQKALNAGGEPVADGTDANALFGANKELLVLHDIIAHRLVQILIGQHAGRTFFTT